MSVKIPGYEILRPIAEGGMASVYLAMQESLGRHVAIKLLKRFDNPDQAKRFQNEGRIIASLNHRNIITIYDIGVYEDRHYIAMEYLEGGDLEERIQNGMSVESALDLVDVMASCLDFLHDKEIIHRDLKPANILFHKDGTPILTDFGVARHLEGDMRLTMEGSAVGSPYYISPEQAECKPLDGRTDIYGLGIIFHEMLTGMKPYQGGSHIETILAHLTEPLPSLPPALERYQGLLDRMIAKDPEERFASASEIREHTCNPRQGGTSVTPASGRFSNPRDLSGFSTLTRVRQMLNALVSTAKITFRKTMTLLPRGNRQRWAATGAMVVFISISILLIKQPSMQVEKTVNSRDSIAMKATPGPSAPGEPSIHAVNQPLLATSHSAEEHPLAEGAEKSVKGKTTYTFTPQASDNQILTNEKLLLRAQRALDEYRLTTPLEDNAYFYYRRILDKDPDHKKALAGVVEIAGIYASLAEQELNRFRYSKARTYIERGLAIDPDNTRLRELESTNTFSDASQRAFGKVKSLFQ